MVIIDGSFVAGVGAVLTGIAAIIRAAAMWRRQQRRRNIIDARIMDRR